MNEVAGKRGIVNEPAAADAELELNGTMFFWPLKQLLWENHLFALCAVL